MDDNERKLLRITYSLYRQEWHKPDLKLLCRLSLRNEDKVKVAVKGLIERGYIESKDGMIRVIEAWERKPREPAKWVPMD